MLLRILLILAILAGAGVLAITHFQVRPHLQSIIDARDDFEKKYKDTDTKLKKTTKDLKDTKTTLETTQKDLASTKTELEATSAKYSEEQRKSGDLQKNLDKTKADLTSAQQELSSWTLLGLTQDQIKALQTAEKSLRAANEGLKEENTVLARKHKAAQQRIEDLVGKNKEDPVLPPGTKGSVLVVDPKWNFVVLDIGERESIVANGVLTVHRAGKLVGKVKVVSVQGPRSIANIMPGWKLDDIMEGDSVFY